MPSWKVHRIIGEIVCNFYDHEIDRLIDLTGRYDAGRYDSKILNEELEYVFKRWDPNSVCYYILHHILDRIGLHIWKGICRRCIQRIIRKLIHKIVS